MSWRTVVISNRCKLDLKLGYMVVRGEETKRVFLDEIAVLMIENTAVSITGCLLAALTERKIKVIFCNEQRNPAAELIPYAGSHDSSAKIRRQALWSKEIKGAVWTEIVSEKIRRQAGFLRELNKDSEAELLESYLLEIQFADATNREGHAAKVYFNAVFGNGFSRSNSEDPVNAALNYGYSLILSMINREISASGYILQIGLFHDNMFNPFNLGCDLMEPFRIIVDRFVAAQSYPCFEIEQKHELLSILRQTVRIGETNQILPNAMRIYVRSVFNAINDGDLSLLQFASYE